MGKESSEYPGVNKYADRWKSFIYINRKRIYLGTYKNRSDAIAARKSAEKKYGIRSKAKL